MWCTVWQLWSKDQLSVALRKGEAFKGFQEGPLVFPPTFKYDVGTDNYDTSIKVSIILLVPPFDFFVEHHTVEFVLRFSSSEYVCAGTGTILD